MKFDTTDWDRIKDDFEYYCYLQRVAGYVSWHPPVQPKNPVPDYLEDLMIRMDYVVNFYTHNRKLSGVYLQRNLFEKKDVLYDPDRNV